MVEGASLTTFQDWASMIMEEHHVLKGQCISISVHLESGSLTEEIRAARGGV
jgi:hypothetical protein